MQIVSMIWSGISGHDAGSALLKGIFIIALVGVFWIACELTKHLVNVFAKLIVDGLRYLAVTARGWPRLENGKKGEPSILRYRCQDEKAENPEQ